MGQRGPAPKPASLHLIRGNPSKIPASQLDGQLRVPAAIPDAPGWLDTEAANEWARLAPLLLELGLVTELDRGALVECCQAWSWYVSLQRAFNELQADARRTASGKGSRLQAAVDVAIMTTPQGYQQQKPIVQMLNKAREEYRKSLAQFGLSPSARSRATPAVTQPSLPGMEPPEAGGWGSI